MALGLILRKTPLRKKMSKQVRWGIGRREEKRGEEGRGGEGRERRGRKGGKDLTSTEGPL